MKFHFRFHYMRLALGFVSILLTGVWVFAVETEVLLGFNWGDGSGVEQAFEAARLDSEFYSSGYRVGPNFWNSLAKAQYNADHRAGDGLYFSTHPWNSARFGPSLMLIEIHFTKDLTTKIIQPNTADKTANTPHRLLPPVIRYAGPWHVIKSLPGMDSTLPPSQQQSFAIYARKAQAEDARKIFDHYRLQNNPPQSLNFLTQIIQREFALFGLKGRNSKEGQRRSQLKKEINATVAYIESLVSLLTDRGLIFDSKTLQDPDQISKLDASIDEFLRAFGNLNEPKKIFKIDLKKLLYKRLLDNFDLLSTSTKRLLFLSHPKLALKYGPSKYLSEMMDLFKNTESLHVNLNLRDTFLKLKKLPISIQEDLHKLMQSTGLPAQYLKSNELDYFNVKLFSLVTAEQLMDYVNTGKKMAATAEEKSGIEKLERRLNVKTSAAIQCRQLF